MATQRFDWWWKAIRIHTQTANGKHVVNGLLLLFDLWLVQAIIFFDIFFFEEKLIHDWANTVIRIQSSPFRYTCANKSAWPHRWQMMKSGDLVLGDGDETIWYSMCIWNEIASFSVWFCIWVCSHWAKFIVCLQILSIQSISSGILFHQQQQNYAFPNVAKNYLKFKWNASFARDWHIIPIVCSIYGVRAFVTSFPFSWLSLIRCAHHSTLCPVKNEWNDFIKFQTISESSYR